MSEPFLGEIRMFGFNFAPRGWADCNGQLLQISQYQALYSLYGTVYGGDGRTTFALPELRGRVPIHYGQGGGLSNYPIGQKGGQENVTLTDNQIPRHTHTFAQPCNTGRGTSPVAQNQFPAAAAGGETLYADAATDNAFLGAGTTGPNGGSQSHENRQPYLVIRFCCALQGLFPSRN